MHCAVDRIVEPGALQSMRPTQRPCSSFVVCSMLCRSKIHEHKIVIPDIERPPYRRPDRKWTSVWYDMRLFGSSSRIGNLQWRLYSNLQKLRCPRDCGSTATQITGEWRQYLFLSDLFTGIERLHGLMWVGVCVSSGELEATKYTFAKSLRRQSLATSLCAYIIYSTQTSKHKCEKCRDSTNKRTRSNQIITVFACEDSPSRVLMSEDVPCSYELGTHLWFVLFN